DFIRFYQTRFGAGHLFVGWINPNRAGHFPENLLVILLRFVTWQRLEIEDDYVAPAEPFAAWIYQLRRAQHGGDGQALAAVAAVVVVEIRLVPGLPRFLGLVLLDLPDAFFDTLLLFGLVFGRERLPIFGDQPADALAFVKRQIVSLGLFRPHLA